VRDLSAYHLEPEPVAIKLNQNENPYDWPGEIKDRVLAFCRARPWNRYPNFIPTELKAALAGYAGVSADQVIVGNGSNEMLLVLLIALMRRDRAVVTVQPTFTVYNLLVNGMGGRPEPVFLDGQMRFDVDAVISRITACAGCLLIICSPNNPTGSTLDEQQLCRILDAHDGMCVLDQAYVEFGGFNAVGLLGRYPNLIITRTFSKAFSAAGLRIGYMMGDPAVIREINKVKLPYNINFFTEYAARAVLENAALMRSRIDGLTASRDDLYRFLKSLPFTAVYPSAANFLMVRLAAKDALFQKLRSDGVLVRDVSKYPMLDGCLRVNVGTPDENESLKRSLARFFR